MAPSNSQSKSSGRQKADAVADPRMPTVTWPSLLEPLGVVGFERLEPVLCAALVSEEPLLLIGPHGTGKSYVLERIAAALGLAWRHYNASLLNYDDLVGYPLPNQAGGLDFVRTPASIWDAEIVFFDEISRCRPDLQNKLFPILHERRVQGIALEKLRYRWAAMNPPPDEEELGEPLYRGSEPLDAALADRFAFIVPVPGWDDYTSAAQERLIVAGGRPVPPEAGQRLKRIVQEARQRLPELQRQFTARLARYARVAADLCGEAGFPLSPRRAATLWRNVLAVHAVRLSLGRAALLADSAWFALSHSLPQAAYGPPPGRHALFVAHHRAWQIADVAADDPRHRIWQQRDPLLRALSAMRVESLTIEERSGIVADALATLPLGSRHALALRLFQSGDAARLVAAVADGVAALYATLVETHELRRVTSDGLQYRIWKRVRSTLDRLDDTSQETRLIENLLTGLFAQDAFESERDVDRARESFVAALARTSRFVR